MFEKETDYKEVVSRYYSESGESPQIQVIQQTSRSVALSVTGLVSSGELDVYVKP